MACAATVNQQLHKEAGLSAAGVPMHHVEESKD